MKKSLSTLAIALLLLSACGKEKVETQMSEQQALDVLNGGTATESDNSRSGLFSKKPKVPSVPKVPVDYAQLMQLISTMAASGQIKVDPSNLASLSTVLNTVSGGNANSALTLALSLASQFSGVAAGGQIDISAIIAILNQVAPIIAVIAPQYAPVIQALLVILPMVQLFLNQIPHAAVQLNWAYCHA